MNSSNMGVAVGMTVCLLAAAAAVLLKKNKQKRQYKIRPINRRRQIKYKYYTNMKAQDPVQFFKFTRMTVPIFDKLLAKVRPWIQKRQCKDGISAQERLLITLQYLSQGTSMQALAWNFEIGLTTVHTIIHETCIAIWTTLSGEYLKPPLSEREWIQIAKGFEKRWNFPHCLGALDGKHVTIQAPARSGSLFFNYKKTFSIVLLAACDSQYRFTLVHIGAYGSQSDGGIFRNSVFGQKLEENNFHIPPQSVLPQTNMEMPYFLVADEAFPLKSYIMRPFPGKNLNARQRIFNYRLSRARQVIENSFGILVARWRVLKTIIYAKVENIVKAVTTLHNFCLIELVINGEESNPYCPTGYVDSQDEENGLWREEQTPLPSVGRLSSNIAQRVVYAIRERLSDYFTSPAGEVAWQNNIVNRGTRF